MSTTSFSEDEKRFLLAEIIKNSRVSINTLLSFIKREHIVPNWQEIYLPSARNLKTCKAVFEELVSSSLAPPQPPSNFEPTPRPTLKRRLSDSEPTPGLARPLHPKPAANGAQFVPSASPVEPTTKKRGRPTKEVLDARRAEAASRGTIYPPLKAAGQKSLGESPLSQQSLGSQGQASEPGSKTGVSSDSPLAKKRRGRPAKDTVGQREILELAPHTMGIPKIISPTEGKDVVHPTPDVSEGIVRPQNPTPSVVPAGATAQGNPGSIQPQNIGSLPPTQP